MDTHIAPHPEPEDRTAFLSARLPGEPLEADEHGDANEPALAAPSADERLATPAPTRRKWRHSMLLGVAIVSLGIAGGSAFLVSPYNHLVPVPGMARAVRHVAVAAGVTLPAPLAPAASLAGVDLPPTPNAVIRPKFTPPPQDQQLSELLRLYPGAPEAASASMPAIRAQEPWRRFLAAPVAHPLAMCPASRAASPRPIRRRQHGCLGRRELRRPNLQRCAPRNRMHRTM